jgi:hypothetical protein
LFLVLGVGFFLDHLGFLKLNPLFWRWWALPVVAIGVLQIVLGAGSRVAGAAVCVMGALFQLRALDLLPGTISSLFWPVMMLVFGFWLIVYRS